MPYYESLIFSFPIFRVLCQDFQFQMQVGSCGPLPTGEGGVSVCVLSLIACTLYQGGTEAGAGDSLALTRTDTG